MRLILHIGTYKTGSTAVQSYFYDHREALLAKGLLYPSTGLRLNDAYGARHMKLAASGSKEKEKKRWTKLHKELDAATAEIALISCETFWRYPKRAAKLGERLGRYKPSIVVGFRRQDRFLASYHLQRVKSLNDNRTPQKKMELWDGWLNYYNALSMWADAFGREAIHPFLYDEKAKNVLPQFFKAAGLPDDMLLIEPTKYQERNRTPEEWSPENILGEDLAKHMLERYEPGNQRLFKEYFPNTHGWPDP